MRGLAIIRGVGFFQNLHKFRGGYNILQSEEKMKIRKLISPTFRKAYMVLMFALYLVFESLFWEGVSSKISRDYYDTNTVENL